MPLYALTCPACGPVEEFAPTGAHEATCSQCGAAATRRYSAPLINPIGWGLAMVPHGPGRRVSKAQAEQHTHWQQTRYGDQAPARLDADYKPTHFTR